MNASLSWQVPEGPERARWSFERCSDLARRPLGDQHELFLGMLPKPLQLSGQAFGDLWNLHPAERPVIHLHGRRVVVPRWQLAYARDYHFSGATSRAEPLPPLLKPLFEWIRASIDERLDGILANWYDGCLGHYMGAHRDSRRGLVPGLPMVTLSFGEERALRFRPWRGSGFLDIPAPHGSLIVIPYDTNLRWTHEVPRSRRARGRRISLTMRAFE